MLLIISQSEGGGTLMFEFAKCNTGCPFILPILKLLLLCYGLDYSQSVKYLSSCNINVLQ